MQRINDPDSADIQGSLHEAGIVLGRNSVDSAHKINGKGRFTVQGEHPELPIGGRRTPDKCSFPVLRQVVQNRPINPDVAVFRLKRLKIAKSARNNRDTRRG
jgi:hypothetical protein